MAGIFEWSVFDWNWQTLRTVHMCQEHHCLRKYYNIICTAKLSRELRRVQLNCIVRRCRTRRELNGATLRLSAGAHISNRRRHDVRTLRGAVCEKKEKKKASPIPRLPCGRSEICSPRASETLMRIRFRYNVVKHTSAEMFYIVRLNSAYEQQKKFRTINLDGSSVLSLLFCLVALLPNSVNLLARVCKRERKIFSTYTVNCIRVTEH